MMALGNRIALGNNNGNMKRKDSGTFQKIELTISECLVMRNEGTEVVQPDYKKV